MGDKLSGSHGPVTSRVVRRKISKEKGQKGPAWGTALRGERLCRACGKREPQSGTSAQKACFEGGRWFASRSAVGAYASFEPPRAPKGFWMAAWAGDPAVVGDKSSSP